MVFKFLLRYPKLISLNFEIRTSRKADVERLALFYLREKKKPSTLTEERGILYNIAQERLQIFFYPIVFYIFRAF